MLFKPQAALRADKAFWLFYEGLMHLFHMEIEARADSDIRYRMLTYHALLYSKYKSPVISLILYPFRTNIPEPPLIEVSAGREVLKFWYHTLPLWELNARQYLDEHALAMYPPAAHHEGSQR